MANIDEFVAKMKDLELRTMRSSPFIAAAMGRAFHDRLVNVTLRMYQHPMYVMTQAPAGGPPAFMSGELAYSVTMDVRGGGSTSRAYVGPHTIYARVQEFGGEMSAHNFEFMRWYMTGVPVPGGPWWYKKHVEVPARPYMRPTRDAMIADGSLHRTAVEAFLAEGL